MAVRFTGNGIGTSKPVNYADPKNAWANPATQKPGISNGVLGYIGVKPEQYTQARNLISAGVPSLNNADRLSGFTAQDLAKRQAASNAGTTFLNGQSIMSPSAVGSDFGGVGGVQSSGAPQSAVQPAAQQANTIANNSAIVDALRQKPQRFAGFGMGAKTPNGLFQSI